jgi:predicted N-acetyltransferase YhbS
MSGVVYRHDDETDHRAMSYRFIPLREKPQHLKAVAEWIHQQWWSNTNTPPDAIERWLGTHLGAEGFPTTLVAIVADDVIGSVSLHETEADDRPAYRPYLGALYVKSSSRGQGIGTALVQALEAHGRNLGLSEIYLNAADPLKAVLCPHLVLCELTGKIRAVTYITVRIYARPYS